MSSTENVALSTRESKTHRRGEVLALLTIGSGQTVWKSYA